MLCSDLKPVPSDKNKLKRILHRQVWGIETKKNSGIAVNNGWKQIY